MSSFTIDEICTISRTERGAWGKVFIKIGNETYTYNFSYMSLELTVIPDHEDKLSFLDKRLLNNLVMDHLWK